MTELNDFDLSVVNEEFASVLSRAYALLSFPAGVEAVAPQDDGEPWAVRHHLGTEFFNKASLTMDQRIGRCYELAYAGSQYSIGSSRTNTPVRLVHGSIHGRFDDTQRIGHGWVLLGFNLVWEPARALVYDQSSWYEWTRAWDERSYTPHQAKQLSDDFDHYGRWHESRYP